MNLLHRIWGSHPVGLASFGLRFFPRNNQAVTRLRGCWRTRRRGRLVASTRSTFHAMLRHLGESNHFAITVGAIFGDDNRLSVRIVSCAAMFALWSSLPRVSMCFYHTSNKLLRLYLAVLRSVKSRHPRLRENGEGLGTMVLDQTFVIIHWMPRSHPDQLLDILKRLRIWSWGLLLRLSCCISHP